MSTGYRFLRGTNWIVRQFWGAVGLRRSWYGVLLGEANRAPDALSTSPQTHNSLTCQCGWRSRNDDGEFCFATCHGDVLPSWLILTGWTLLFAFQQVYWCSQPLHSKQQQWWEFRFFQVVVSMAINWAGKRSKPLDCRMSNEEYDDKK